MHAQHWMRKPVSCVTSALPSIHRFLIQAFRLCKPLPLKLCAAWLQHQRCHAGSAWFVISCNTEFLKPRHGRSSVTRRLFSSCTMGDIKAVTYLQLCLDKFECIQACNSCIISLIASVYCIGIHDRLLPPAWNLLHCHRCACALEALTA